MESVDVKLSKARVTRINEGLRTLHDLEPKIAALERCEEDCTEFREVIDRLLRELTLLKENFS